MAIKAFMAVSGREVTLSPSEEKAYLADLEKQNQEHAEKVKRVEKIKLEKHEKIKVILEKFKKIGITYEDLKELEILR